MSSWRSPEQTPILKTFLLKREYYVSIFTFFLLKNHQILRKLFLENFLPYLESAFSLGDSFKN